MCVCVLWRSGVGYPPNARVAILDGFRGCARVHYSGAHRICSSIPNVHPVTPIQRVLLAVTHTTCRRYLCAVGKYAEAAEVIREAAKANGKVRTVAIAPLLLPCELAYALLVVAGHAAVYIETHPGPRGCQCQQAVRPGAPQEHVAHLARVVRFRGRLLWGTVAGALCGATLVLAC